MTERVSFTVRPVAIEPDVDGAERLLSHLSKPRNPLADMKKLRNWRLWLDPIGAPFEHRSRRQILEGVHDVWRRLNAAVAIGDRFDRMIMYHEGEVRRVDEKISEYARPASATESTQWKSWLPVAHMAAGFRAMLFSREMALAFDLSRTITERESVMRHLLLEDHSWIAEAIEHAEARLVLSRGHIRIQAPAETRHFMLVPKASPSAANS